MKPIAVLLLAVACSAPTKTVPALVIPTTFQAAEDVLGGTWTGRAMTTFAAMLGPPPRVTGSIMMPMQLSACESPLLGVLPYVTWVHKEPRVGELIEIEWTTLALGAPRDWAAVVLCGRQGTRSMHPSGIEVDGVPLGQFGTIFVDIDPKHAKWVFPGGEGAMLSRRPQDAGRIRLRWTPTPDQVGEVWWFHLVCFNLPPSVAPRTDGKIVSPGLRVEIGSARN